MEVPVRGRYSRVAQTGSSQKCLDFFQIGWFSKSHSLQGTIDAAAESNQDRPRAHFDEAADASAGDLANRIGPTDRIGNLLIEPYAGILGAGNEAGLPIVDQRNLEMGEGRGLQFRAQFFLGRAHEGTVEGSTDRK